MAPNRFIAIMAEMSPLDFSSVENTIPEKNIGDVSTIAVPIRPAHVEGSPPALEIHQPAAKVANNNR